MYTEMFESKFTSLPGEQCRIFLPQPAYCPVVTSGSSTKLSRPGAWKIRCTAGL